MNRAEPSSFQEMLRTLGGVLDVAGCDVAVVEIHAGGARLHAHPAAARVDWTLAELLDAHAEQRHNRQRIAAERVTENAPGDRLLGRTLRVVGAALDRHGPGPYTIMITPSDIFAFDGGSFYHCFTSAELHRRTTYAWTFRTHQRSDDSGSRR